MIEIQTSLELWKLRLSEFAFFICDKTFILSITKWYAYFSNWGANIMKQNKNEKATHDAKNISHIQWFKLPF